MSFVALEELTWPEAERLGTAGAAGLIALASLEQHGPHLPLGTDSLFAEVLARQVAERLAAPVVAVPVLRGGLSTHHLGFPGTVTVAPEVYRGLVLSYLDGLERMGIRKVGLFSSHGGNFAFLADFVATYDGPLQLAGYSNLARFGEVMHQAAATCGLRAPEMDIHAGGLETSAMLAYFPQLVGSLEGVTGIVTAEFGWLDRVFSEGVRALSETGVLGDPENANADAGRAIIAALAEELSAFLAARLDLVASHSGSPS